MAAARAFCVRCSDCANPALAKDDRASCRGRTMTTGGVEGMGVWVSVRGIMAGSRRGSTAQGTNGTAAQRATRGE